MLRIRMSIWIVEIELARLYHAKELNRMTSSLSL
jgi:hypothetical protein